jgi:hypothetical protein
MPATRRSAAIKGLPRSRWISAFSTDDQRVEWFKPRTSFGQKIQMPLSLSIYGPAITYSPS